MATRKNTFLLKRSNVAGNIPTAGQIQLGELALNTADVKLYASGTTTNSILPIGWDRISRTGDTMTGTLYVPTISATTYQNLPLDIRVTGGTYAGGTATFTNNTGGTFTVTGFGGGSSTGLTASNYIVQGKLAADQTIPTTTDTVIAFIDDYDSQGWYDPTSKRFTPTVAGYYLVDAGVWMESSTGTTGQANLQARFNGNTIAIVQSPNNNQTGNSFVFTKIVYFNGTSDYMDFTFYQNTGLSRSILQGTANGSGTWFSAALMVGGNLLFTGGTISGPANAIAGFSANTISATTITAGTFTGNLTGTASLATSATTALNATNVGVTNNTTTNAVFYPTFVSATSGNLPLQVDSSTLTFNPSTNTLTVPNLSGLASLATSATTALNATNTDYVYITDDATTNADYYLVWTNNSNAISRLYTDAARLKYNPSTDTLTTTRGVFTTSLNTSTLTATGLISGPSVSATTINGVTISAATYLNLPTDVRVTGGTYNAGTATFTNNTGGTFNVTGFNTNAGVTAFTYNNANTFTINNAYSATINTVTGFTVNGNLSAATIDQVNYIDFNTGVTSTNDAGRISWNDPDGTYNMGLYNGVTLQVGQEENVYGKASSAITMGDVVMYNGNQGDHVLLARANPALTDDAQYKILGIATQDFTANQFGYITTFGKVRELNTIAYSAGTILYFNSTGTTLGGYTNVEPPAPYANVVVGSVLRSHATQGIILVRPSFRFPYHALEDVQITNVQNNDIVQYSGALGYYVNTNNPKFTSISATTMSAVTFTGNLTGLASLATSATTALNATNVGVTNNTSTNATYYLGFVSATSGNLPLQVDSTTLTFNPSTNILTLPNIVATGTITATTISATTYLNLPTDIRVTGGTYSTGTATFRNNTGGTFTVTGFNTGNGTVTSVAALTLGTSGTDLNSTVANPTTTPVITLNVPDASATARGVITTGVQTIAGVKTLTSQLNGTVANFSQSSAGTSLTGYNGGVGNTGINGGAANGIGGYFVNNSTTYPVVRLLGLSNTRLLEGRDTSDVATFSVTSTGIVSGSSFVRIGGTSAQFLKADGTVDSSTYVPSTRTITINGTAQDLSVNRSWTVPTVTANTINNATYDLTISTSNGTNYTANLGVLATDVKVTGGTYNPTTGVVTFTNTTGGTFNVTGFSTGMTDTFVTGGTYSTGTATFTRSNGATFNVTGFNTGTVTGVNSGNGMNFSNFTTSGTITMGTPSSTTLSSTNATTTNSHTHAFAPGGTAAQYITGAGALATFPAIPTVNDGTLTMATSGIATGSASFTANQAGTSTFTVNVPATDLSIGVSSGTQVRVDSSTGADVDLPVASATLAGIVTTGAQTFAGTKTFSSTISGNINGTANNSTLLDNIASNRFVFGSNGSGSNGASTTYNAYELSQYKSGFWDVNGASWTPTGDWYWGLTTAHQSNSSSYNYSAQQIYNLNGTESYFRSVANGVTNPWRKVWHDGNITPVPTSRTLTINGTTFDLSANRSWTISSSGGITGGGDVGYLPKFTGSTAVGNSQIYDNGTSVGINTTSPNPSFKLDVNGATSINGPLSVSGSPTTLQYVRVNSDIDLFNSHVDSENYGTFSRLRLSRASGTQVSPTTPSSGTAVGRLEFGAYNSGTGTFIMNAKVEAVMDATTGANDLPSRLSFFTTPDGSTTMAEVMRVNSLGNMRIGGLTMALSDVINVENGSVAFQNGYGLRFQSTGGTLYASVYSNNNDTVIKSLGDAIRFKNRAGTANRMSILDGGFVGVNTNTPNQWLDVNGDALINGLTVGLGNSAYNNAVLGNQALGANTTGYNNVAIHSALPLNTTGTNNVGVGYKALFINTIGNDNVAVGAGSLQLNTSGEKNISIGSNSSYNNDNGQANIVIGADALFTNVNGSSNVAMGYNALYTNTGGANLALGHYAGYTLDGDGNNIIGTSNNQLPDGNDLSNQNNTLSISKHTQITKGMPHFWAPDSISISPGSGYVLEADPLAYSAVFIDYSLEDQNGNLRAGTLKAIFNVTLATIKWDEVATSDIGSTSNYTFDFMDNGSGILGVELTNSGGVTVYCNLTSRLVSRTIL